MRLYVPRGAMETVRLVKGLLINKPLYKLSTIYVKVIPQKLNLPMNFFETFPESSLLGTVSKKTKK